MPYGKYTPEKEKVILNMKGKKVPFKTPAGYAGLFWGTVYDSKEKIVDNASDYFWELSEKNECNDFEYWETISNIIEEHCQQFVAPYCGHNHHYQCGFGGDKCNGLIDFWTEKPIPDMPDVLFKIEGKEYLIKWEYSEGGSDSDSEGMYYSQEYD